MKSAWTLTVIILFFVALPVVGLTDDDPPVQYCIVQNVWKKILIKNGITVYSQKAPGSDLLALKATGILEAPTGQIMEVLRNVDISKEWIPHIGKKVSVKEFSDLEAITYSVNVLPWPFADRSLLLHNKLRLDKERKYLVVEIYSVDFETFSIRDDHVRAFMHCGQMIMRPIGTEQTEIELTLFLDPRGQIPTWLVNMAQRTMPYNFLKALEKKAGQTNYELRPSFNEMLEQLIVLLEN